MTDEIKVEEVLDLVQKAQGKNVFDITEFAKGRSYPQDTVVAYLDVEGAYELTKLNDEMRGVTDPAELEPLEAKAQELAKKVAESKITVYMRGINQASIEKITKDCNEKYPPKQDVLGRYSEDENWLQEWTALMVGSNIVKIENHLGEIDDKDFGLEKMTMLRHHLPKAVWDMLVDKMQKLTLATAYFDGMTDAGFLPKS